MECREQKPNGVRNADGKLWAVSPDNSDEILQLEFEKEFALLMGFSADPEKN